VRSVSAFEPESRVLLMADLEERILKKSRTLHWPTMRSILAFDPESRVLLMTDREERINFRPRKPFALLTKLAARGIVNQVLTCKKV